ncbi:MAG: dicarboxylate/amino acid:cation symporter [Verrucomicrobiaceae bacterium]|jgi:aerobic C4-dicarboxylate transport protein|nr:dicarboxylate/amino acid:cation symporter [Verrucomicrobiaceae bacterium]
MKWLKSLYVQVLIGIVLGVLLGLVEPETGATLEPLGTAFVNAVKMLIAPIIFCTVVHGIAGMGDLKKLGSVGWKALLYFEVVTTLALIIGLVVAKVVEPGAGMHVDPAQAAASQADMAKVEAYQSSAEKQTVAGHLMHIIPKTFVSAFAEGEILQVLFIAILAGIALARLGERARGVTDLLHAVSQMFFGIVWIVTKAAPVAAFGAMAFTIGKYGVGALGKLLLLLACVYLTCLLFVFVVLGLIARWNGFSIWKVLVHIKEELLLTLGTSSSEAALPALMEKMERTGCSKGVVGIVLPAGYSFNLDGTSIYLTMAALFVAQATDTHLTFWQELGILGVLLLTSKGAAAVTGGGFITLAATLASTGTIPVAGLAIILGIDRFMSEARAITNLIGNTLAMLVVAKWEGEFDATNERAKLLLR